MKPTRLASSILILVLLAGAGHAKNDGALPAEHPLLARIAGSSVARGREHRALLVYPIAADFADPAKPERPRSSAEAKAGEDLSVGEPEKNPGRDKVEVFNWSTEPTLLLAGEILTGGHRDRSLDRDVLVQPGSKVEAPVSAADRRPREEAERRKALVPFGAITPDLMRLVGIENGPEAEAQKFLDGQFTLAAEKGDRRSLEELFAAKALAGRLAEYETIFEAIPDEAAKKAVGAAAFVGDRLVGIDLFETNSAFRAHWKSLLRTHALQAALYEAAYGLLNQPQVGGFRPGGAGVRDPDRHGKRVSEVLKKLFAARVRPADAIGAGEEVLLTREEVVSRVLTDGERLVHAVVLLDYLDSATGLPPPPGTTPTEYTSGELERRAERGTLTEYEKRLLQRMRERARPAPKLEPPRREEDPGIGGR